MGSNVLLIVLLVLVSISLTSARDAVSKQDDESYVLARNDQGSSMIVVEDLVKARSLQTLVVGSKVVVNKAVSKSSSSTKSSKKRKHKRNKVGNLDVSAIVGIIIAAVVVTIVIICVIYFFYVRRKTKRAQENIKVSSETQTSKTEDHV